MLASDGQLNQVVAFGAGLPLHLLGEIIQLVIVGCCVRGEACAIVFLSQALLASPRTAEMALAVGFGDNVGATGLDVAIERLRIIVLDHRQLIPAVEPRVKQVFLIFKGKGFAAASRRESTGVHQCSFQDCRSAVHAVAMLTTATNHGLLFQSDIAAGALVLGLRGGFSGGGCRCCCLRFAAFA